METRNDTTRGASYDGVVTPPVEKASVFEDYIDIFHAPSQVFARRAASGFGLHLLLVSLISAALAFANRGFNGCAIANICAQIHEADPGRSEAIQILSQFRIPFRS